MKQLACLLLVACSAPSAFAGERAPAAVAAFPQSAEGLVQKGRALLEQKKPAEALLAFEEADKLAGGGLATRQWVLRARLDLGQVDAVLSDVEKLESQGRKGAAIDYLYGMCFAARAKKSIAEGGNGGIIAMAFADSATYLKSALKAEPKLYPDGWRTLAESAWNAQDLPAAREAADTACALAPEDDAARAMLGKVCFSQYSAAKDDEARKAEAAAHLEAAREAFEGALRLCVARKEPEWRATEASVRVELARVHAWKGDKAAAAREYGAAFGLSPQSIDIGEARGVLDSAQFVSALEAARDAYAAAWGVEGSGDAGVWWWLGYARYTDKKFEGAEEAFAKALAKWPDFVNSHYYIAMSRYFRQDYDGAVEWLWKHHVANAADCAASLAANKDENVRILDYLIGVLVPKGRNLEASRLARRGQGRGQGLVGGGVRGLRQGAGTRAEGPELPERHRGDAPLLPRPRPRQGALLVQAGGGRGREGAGARRPDQRDEADPRHRQARRQQQPQAARGAARAAQEEGREEGGRGEEGRRRAGRLRLALKLDAPRWTCRSDCSRRPSPSPW